MTIGWAVLIVAILFLLSKHQMLGRALRVLGVVTVIAVVGTTGWVGWSRLDANWEEHRSKATFARKHECLSPSTGIVYSVDESGAPWCKGNDVIQERGTPVDQWAIITDMPTVPPGDYYVIDGERGSDDPGSTSVAQLCVDSNGTRRCYTQQHPSGPYAKAEELKTLGGGRLILFTTAGERPDRSGTTIALLANRGGQLENLLPPSQGYLISQADYYRIWNLADISNMPILLTTSVDLGQEAMVDPHRYWIASYVYNKQLGHYVRSDYYSTAGVFPNGGKALDSERYTIMAGLKKEALAEEVHHLIIKPEYAAQPSK